MGDEETSEQIYSVQFLDGDREKETWISRSGKASVVYANGDRYTGEYNQTQQRHGTGLYKYNIKNPEDEEAPAQLAIYEGDFQLGKKHGMGKMVYPGGAIYNGSWVNNMRSGQGSYTYENGDVFNGNWVDDKKSGQGSYYYKETGSQLIGEWKENTYIRGSCVHSDNTSLHCNWNGNTPVGTGVYYFASNGNQLEGKFETVQGEDEEAPPTTTWSSEVLTRSSVNSKDLIRAAAV